MFTEWLKEKVNWSHEKWVEEVFSNEKMFNLDSPNEILFYWHDLHGEEEIFWKKPFGGSSVMNW